MKMKAKRTNTMKTIQINKAFCGILSSIDEHCIVNSFFGGSNLTGEYLNDYRTESIEEFIGEWLDDNLNKPHMSFIELSAVDVISNPDCLLQWAASEFFSALHEIIGKHHPAADIETIWENANCKFDSLGDYYIFADPVSNACARWYIIRYATVEEAYEELTCEFERHFIIEDEADIVEGESEINDNGNPVNTDNLRLIGCIKVEG